MLNLVLCDSNPNTLSKLENMLESIFIKHDISASIMLSANTSDQVSEFLKSNSANVFIIDFDLKGSLSGLELAAKIRSLSKDAYLIFHTSHFEYVLYAYKYKTFDYLPKPVSYSKLEQTILRLVDDIQTNVKSYLRLNKNLVIDKNNINYIKKDGMQVIFSTRDGNYKTYSLFNKLEEILPPNFIRCHKSFIANINNISNVEMNKNVIYFNEKDTCFIGPKYKRYFMEVLYNGNFSNNINNIQYTQKVNY